MLIPECSDFKQLYIGNVTGSFKIRTDKPFEVVSNKKVSVEGTGIVTVTVSA